jgi:hypothetical protein
MPRCKNTVEQFVQKGWDYKKVVLPCGSTSVRGNALYCSECSAKNAKRGHAPNECRHGVNVYDGFCGRCEFE